MAKKGHNGHKHRKEVAPRRAQELHHRESQNDASRDFKDQRHDISWRLRHALLCDLVSPSSMNAFSDLLSFMLNHPCYF
jgi:hypothetical protein